MITFIPSRLYVGIIATVKRFQVRLGAIIPGTRFARHPRSVPGQDPETGSGT